ncbi:hypothetical protein LguiB_026249 [Lonicera macranthoides]
MACEVTQIWTFTGLVGAFLDLIIAYFLLSASFIVFFVSKLLGIFGLSLPCPCNGQFGNANHKYCLQKNLLDCPIEKISSVQFNVKNKFPFDSILVTDRCFDSNTKLTGDNESKRIDGFGELEGEGSCSTKRSENGVGFGVLSGQGVKGKGFSNKRSRAGIRRRRKGGRDYGRSSSVSSYDPLCVEPHWGFESISSNNKERDEKIEARTTAIDFGRDDEGETPRVMKLGYDGDEEKTQIFLEQALQEEQAARAALYLDLEKERNAAATAADEAMAMIMRLQQEKAYVEMEAKQYQRLIEEKSAYDEEEMNILKEILLRKERETHYLEKEVEAYRQMGYSYTGNEQFQPNSLLDPPEDPVLMLQQPDESIDQKESIRNVRSDSALTLHGKQMQNFSPPLGKELSTQGWGQRADLSKQRDLEEQFPPVSKHIDNDPYTQPEKGLGDLRANKKYNSQEHNLLVKTIPIVGEESVKSRNVSPGKYTSKGSKDSMFEKESRVLDVHVVDDDSKRISRASSDMTAGLPPTGSRGKSVTSNMRRSSMSALDSERLKIETEVGWLRERLRTVQQGRDKLNISVDYKEREKLQLQLLDDITRQLQEIRQLTEPGKASLPPLSSKAMLSKKRRCRSASLGVQNSY